MLNFLKAILILFLFIVITSCSSDISDYQETTPHFDIQNYFTGDLLAWGMVQDYSNHVTRRFCVEITGTWKDNNGILEEIFYFDDGEVSYRNWQLTKISEDQYSGSAEDVVGIAKGKQTGFAFHWQYKLLVTVGEQTYQFDMDDWMYKIES